MTRTCASCGAAGDGAVCASCGADLSAAPPVAPAAPPCPACEGESGLEHVGIGGVSADICRSCRGLWLDSGELQRLLEPARVHGLLGGGEPVPPTPREPVRYRRCPRCQELMNRQNHGRSSGVIVDACRAHGTWLDGGELDALRRFAADGGATSETPAPLPPAQRDRKDEEWREALHSFKRFLGMRRI